MPITTFSPATKILSSTMNTNLAGLADGSLDVTANQLATYRKSVNPGWVVSGLTIATSANLNSTVAAGVAIVNGKYVAVSSTGITVTASKDTYIYLKDDGTIVTTNNVANNGTSPACTTNSDGSNALLLGILISSGTAITTVNQGSPTAVLPLVSSVAYSVCDGLGNLIYPTSPTPTLIGYRQVVAAQTGITTNVALTGLSVPVIVPAGRRIRIRSFIPNINATLANTGPVLNTYDGTTTAGTLIQSAAIFMTSAGTANSMVSECIQSPATGLKNYIVSLSSNNATSVSAAATSPTFIAVDLV